MVGLFNNKKLYEKSYVDSLFMGGDDRAINGARRLATPGSRIFTLSHGDDRLFCKECDLRASTMNGDTMLGK